MIDLTGLPLTSVRLDDASLILLLGLGEGWLLSVENDYELSRPAGRLRSADGPGAEARAVAALTGLLGSPLDSWQVEPDGGLTLAVTGHVLYVPPDASFEAWQVSGPGGALVVSMPGGDLAVWSGDARGGSAEAGNGDVSP
ncbi:DUF6188 family protein [Nocardioides solisilvae]|uniref:DUF6188 family protein n=1 Tax=Nocardioides solisilvae TaxID=1542435 RepID=UPI000D74A7B1|nr:DUF6188 family protein [Nocardioides solisilvae]